MEAKLIDFQTGWYEVNLGLRKEEIDTFITMLQQLKSGIIDEIQAGGDYEGKTGIGDIIFYLQKANDDNLIFLGPSIKPNG